MPSLQNLRFKLLEMLPEDLRERLRLQATRQQIAGRVVTVVQRGEATAFAEQLYDACRKDGIPFLIGGSFVLSTPRINIHVDDIPRFEKAFRRIAGDQSDVFLVQLGKRVETYPRYVPGRRILPVDIAIVRARSDTGEVFASLVEVALWHDIVRFGKPRVTPNRPHATASRARKFADLLALGTLETVADEYTDTARCGFPIDVVFTWVDGDDQSWLEEKNRYAGKQHPSTEGRGTALLDERFRSQDELKYALRSLWMFAPFVRNIYVVTADQRPDWLKTEGTNLRIISHREIFRQSDDLPTFNSHSIEANLHHIDGLAEHFIYMNDDMFFGQISDPTDFFAPNGIAKIYPEPLHVRPDLIDKEAEEYLQADVKAINLFRRDFHASPSRLMLHVPYAVRRSIMKEVETRYPEEFAGTSSHRFRSTEDLAPLSFFYCHYATLIKEAVMTATNHRYVPLYSAALSRSLNQLLRTRQTTYFCLNDAGVEPERLLTVKKYVSTFLESYFGMKSPYEM